MSLLSFCIPFPNKATPNKAITTKPSQQSHHNKKNFCHFCNFCPFVPPPTYKKNIARRKTRRAMMFYYV